MAKLNNKQESTQKSETEFKNITENGGIEIRFIGKTNALRIVRKVKPWTLKEITELSIGSEKEKSKNLVIEGDNLKAMSSLYQYHGKIDLILTDPPYNTGKDFRYNDKWDEEPNDEGLGDYVKSDDPSRHTKWLKFMVPRLQVMKKMLKLGGVLAICIDERELSRLLPLLDEEKIMFGEENRLAIISWQKAYAPKKTNHVSTATEHVLVYTKSLEKSATGKLEQTEIQKSRFTNPDNDPKGEWRSTTSLIRGGNKNCIYAIQNPFTGLLMYPYEGSSWRYSRKTMKSFLEEWGSEYEERNLENNNTSSLILKGFNLKNLENLEKDPVFQQARKKANEIYNRGAWPRLIYLRKGLGKIRFKLYFAEVKEGVAPLNWWDYEDDAGGISWHQQISGYTQQGTAELKARVEFESDFIGVKPLKLFTKIIQLWCPEGGLVMDPFAGSGTTGNAVLELNNLSKEVEREREREREREMIHLDRARI